MLYFEALSFVFEGDRKYKDCPASRVPTPRWWQRQLICWVIHAVWSILKSAINLPITRGIWRKVCWWAYLESAILFRIGTTDLAQPRKHSMTHERVGSGRIDGQGQTFILHTGTVQLKHKYSYLKMTTFCEEIFLGPINWAFQKFAKKIVEATLVLATQLKAALINQSANLTLVGFSDVAEGSHEYITETWIYLPWLWIYLSLLPSLGGRTSSKNHVEKHSILRYAKVHRNLQVSVLTIKLLGIYGDQLLESLLGDLWGSILGTLLF